MPFGMPAFVVGAGRRRRSYASGTAVPGCVESGRAEVLGARWRVGVLPVVGASGILPAEGEANSKRGDASRWEEEDWSIEGGQMSGVAGR